MRFSVRPVELLPVVAALLFLPLLAWRKLGPLDFWWGMSLSVALLITLSFFADPSLRSSLLRDWREDLARKISLAVISALVLYGIFWVGNAAARAFLPWAAGEISSVYTFKQGAAAWRIGLLILFVIGPGEEFFWRGFIQRRWQQKLGSPFGWLLASIFYAAVHIGSGNFMLVLSALVCGLFWGAIYARSQSVAVVAISHTVWDLLIFILLPFG